MTVEPLVVAHSSDLHLGDDHGGGGNLLTLHVVIRAAHQVGAQVLLLAGDIFDHNRLKLPLLDAAATVMGEADLEIVILPGNHDCLAPNSVYRRGGLGDPDNVTVLGITVGETVSFPEWDLAIWGRPHPDNHDMSPLSHAPERVAGAQIATAHGHFVTGRHDSHRSWLIHDEDLMDLDADYVALGHWDVPQAVGSGSRPAYYSGSPDMAGSINVIRFDATPGMGVRRHPVRLVREDAAASPDSGK